MKLGRSSPSPRAAKWLGFLLLLPLTALLVWQFRTPSPPVPTPAGFDQLDPQLQEHLRQLLTLARQNPRQPEPHATLGIACAANGLWSDARAFFRNTRTLRPNDPLPLMYEGVATQELGDLPAARTLFLQLTTGFPDFPQGHYRLGDLSLRLGDLETARAAFARLAQLAPNEWRGPAGLGEVHLRQRQPTEAIAHLQRAVQLAPHEKMPRFLLGQALRDAGRPDDARRELAFGQGAVHLPMPDPWSARAHEHMKLLPDLFQMTADYNASGRPEISAAILEKALPFHPDNVTLQLRLAEAWTQAGRAEEAVRLLARLLQTHPRNASVLVGLSFSSAQLGRFDDALQQADQAIALAPAAVEAHLARANALLGLEKDADAFNALRQAAAVDPRNVQVQIEAGDVSWRNLGRTNEALAHYRAAATIDPASAVAFARIAELSLELKDAPAARAALAELRHLAPDHPLLPALNSEIDALNRP